MKRIMKWIITLLGVCLGFGGVVDAIERSEESWMGQGT